LTLGRQRKTKGLVDVFATATPSHHVVPHNHGSIGSVSARDHCIRHGGGIGSPKSILLVQPDLAVQVGHFCPGPAYLGWVRTENIRPSSPTVFVLCSIGIFFDEHWTEFGDRISTEWSIR
jgi:hypothetical protein